MSEPLLELRSITKSYPGVKALRGVDLSVGKGEVVGLIGENGAGKSTLMKILGGVVKPSSGSVMIDGVSKSSLTVKDAAHAGIAFVHQELHLFENLDVAANIYIGREPRKGGILNLIDNAALHQRVKPCCRVSAWTSSRTIRSMRLSIAQRQMVEIAKALSMDARIIIMDEPTSSLTLTETDKLLEGHRRPQGRRRQHHLHLAPAQRGEAMRRPGRGAARRPAGRRAGESRDHAAAP